MPRRDPDPEGTIVRADGARGKPRREREGVLLLPRLDTDALVDARTPQIPAGGVSLRAAAGGEPEARAQRAGVRGAGHGVVRRREIFRRVRRICERRSERPADRGAGALRPFLYGDSFTIELPAGSERKQTLAQIAREFSRRLVTLFLPDADGRRPAPGEERRFADDPPWREWVWFHEYFHGETGQGLGGESPDRLDGHGHEIDRKRWLAEAR